MEWLPKDWTPKFIAVDIDGTITDEKKQLNTRALDALKRLEENGVIKGYRAMLDPIQLGREHVAFVEIRLSDTRETALKAFNTAVRAIPEIEQAHLIAGNFDYLLKVRVSDMSSYRQVLAEKLSTLPHISNTSTYVAMQAVKEDSSEAF